MCAAAVRRVQRSWRSGAMTKEADRRFGAAVHRVAGAFFTPEQLKTAREACSRAVWLARDEALDESLLRLHASTRERLPLARMDAVYAAIFEMTGAARARARPRLRPESRCISAARGLTACIAAATSASGAVELINALGKRRPWTRARICWRGPAGGNAYERSRSGADAEAAARCWSAANGRGAC